MAKKLDKKKIAKLNNRYRAAEIRFSARKESIKQAINFLVENDGFISDINEIRRRWKIPNGGFLSPNKDALDWEDKLKAKTPDYQFSKDFLAFIRRDIQTKLDLLDVSSKDIVEQIIGLYVETGKLTPSKQYYYEIHKIKIGFRLDDRWVPFLTNLVEFGSKQSHLTMIEKGYELIAKMENDVNERQVFLRLYPDAQSKEIEYAWKRQIKNQLQKFLKPIRKRSKISPNESLDRQFYLLHQEGRSYKEILDIYADFLRNYYHVNEASKREIEQNELRLRINRYKNRHKTAK